MSEPPSKRRRVELCPEDKLTNEPKMLPKHALNMLSEKYGVGKSTIGDIVR
ncbi:hypothetical protein DPMN_009570 [Dreissena polymorpha]|uniref:Uncharacterized protein n=1 Tax=Dreissena polymorpha TaxID=45954 RepID=A0A9D4MYB2_DREPO|nr:hypothetical protein DPMN_009570 [Dreissena polymorpha]